MLICLLAGTVNVSLLRNQQQRLAAMNACSVLFRHQNLLRHVLKHHTLGSSPSLEVLNEGEELDPISETLLIKKLIAKAIQPSPLKAIFGKSDIQVSFRWFSYLKRLYGYPYTE
jgi:E3 ubiquitin-protein ligase HERC2